MKAKIPLRGRLGGVIVDTKATRGAIVGVNLYWADGSLVQVSDFAAAAAATAVDVPTGPVSRTLWSLVAEIPVNVSAVASLSTDGFVRKAGDVWTATDPLASEISYDPTASGLSATDVQAALDELAVSGVAASRTTVTLTSDATAAIGGDFIYFLSAANLALPTAVGNAGLYIVKNVGATSQTVTPDGTETIDGSAGAITLATQDALTLTSDGANWEIV